MSSKSARLNTHLNNKWSQSLWIKTLVGFFFSFLVSTSFFLVIGFALPMPKDVFLLIAVIGGFTLWSSLLAWFYSVSSIKQPFLFCLTSLVITGSINTWFYLQGAA